MAKNSAKNLKIGEPDKHIIEEYYTYQICTEQRPDRVPLVIQLSPAMIVVSAGLLMQAAQRLDEEFDTFDAELAQLYASTAYELRAARAGSGNVAITPQLINNGGQSPVFQFNQITPTELDLKLPAWEDRANPPRDQFIYNEVISPDNALHIVYTGSVLSSDNLYYTHHFDLQRPPA